MKTLIQFIGLSFLFISNSVRSQEIKHIRDIGLWTSVGVNYKFNKKWKTTLIQEIRTFDNAIKLQKSITDLGLNYRINKQFKLGASIRYKYGRKKDYTFTNDIRYNVDFGFKSKLTKQLNFYYRFRFQHSYINLFTYLPDVDEKSNARNRIKLEYSHNKHAYFIAAELFREYAVYKTPEFNNLRLTIGDKLETKLGDFKYGIGYEKELNKEHSLDFFFLKLNYTFKLKHE